MDESLSFKRLPEESHRKGEDSYRSWISSGSHQGVSYYKLAPKNRHGRFSIFQETPQRVIIRLNNRIGRESARGPSGYIPL